MAGTRNRIPGVASARFHRMLLLSARFSRLNGIWLAVYIELFTLLTLFIWALRMESLNIGLAVGIAFLTLAVLDWVALSQLPRRGRSFGPVAPPLLVLVPVRAAITIVPVLMPLSPLWIATLVEVGNFALTGYVLDSLWGEPFRLTVTKLTRCVAQTARRAAAARAARQRFSRRTPDPPRRKNDQVDQRTASRPHRVHRRFAEFLVSRR